MDVPICKPEGSLPILNRADKYQRQAVLSECTFETARSGGKGGQHVNKTESKVTLVFDVQNSNVLSEEIKARIKNALQSRIHQGVLRVSSEATRSQHQNKQNVIDRFFHLLNGALKDQKKRIPTKVSNSQKVKRLKAKKEHAEKKSMRKKIRKFDLD